MSYQESVLDQVAKYKTEFFKYNMLLKDNPTLSAVADVVLLSASEARTNAGYGGESHDGGAGLILEKLIGFLEGYILAQTGQCDLYSDIVKDSQKKQDPMYLTYLDLKAYFGE